MLVEHPRIVVCSWVPFSGCGTKEDESCAGLYDPGCDGQKAKRILSGVAWAEWAVARWGSNGFNMKSSGSEGLGRMLLRVTVCISIR